MEPEGRAIAIAELLRIHGPSKTRRLIALLNAGRHDEATALAMWNRDPDESGEKE